MENIFTQAVMNGVLFNTPVGFLNVVQVAQLPLLSNKGVSLDNLYIGLKESEETYSKSIIPLTPVEASNLKLRVGVITSIIEFKKAELVEKAKAKENAEMRKALIDALSKKQASVIESMTVEEIQAKLKELA